MRSLAIAGALLLVAGAASAAESPVPLKDAPGRQLVENNCAGCHSLDYPRINAPFLDRKGWEAEVAKMINAYGAPLWHLRRTEVADSSSLFDAYAATFEEVWAVAEPVKD